MNEYKQYFLAIIILLAIGAGTYFITKRLYPAQAPVPQMPAKVNGNATTFSNIGLITFSERDDKPQLTPYFTYSLSENGATTTSTLEFDELSICGAANGSIQCMAMSTTFDVPFGNRQAIVEGISQGSSILVRKLYTLVPGENTDIPQTGSVFVSWPQAINFIESCGVKTVVQGARRDVSLRFNDDSVLKTVEPVAGEIQKVIENAKSSCGDIMVATE